MFNLIPPQFTIPVFAMLAWVAVVWIRAHYGINGSLFGRKHGWGNQQNTQVPPMFQKLLEKAMEERDVEIRKLRDRIEVLEKIVTDGHKGASLADEIERLRDKA